MMTDCHTHLEDDRLFPEAEQIIADFSADGLDFVVNGSSDLNSMKRAFALAEAHERVFTTVGFHPNDVEGLDSAAEQLMAKFAESKKVVAVGEIGLDYHYDTPSPEVQRKGFLRQLSIAHELRLPVVLHIRDAYSDALEILKNNAALLKEGVVLHCYSGSRELAAEFLKLDCFFSFGGAITFKNAKKEDIIKSVPTDRLLAETDAPYMTPEPFRGKTNYPRLIKYVYQKMADVLGVSAPQVEKMTESNALSVFKRIKL